MSDAEAPPPEDIVDQVAEILVAPDARVVQPGDRALFATAADGPVAEALAAEAAKPDPRLVEVTGESDEAAGSRVFALPDQPT